MRFVEKLENAMDKNDSLLCVGLDTDLSKIPDYLKDDENPLLSFNKEVVSHTKDLVCSYKINLAFYEASGIAGVKALIDTVKIIPDDIPVIIDGKRGEKIVLYYTSK